VKLWDEVLQSCTAHRSAASVALDLNLDPKAFPPISRTGALLIGEELRKRGSSATRRHSELFADFCAQTWNWDSSPYIRYKLDRGQRIGREHVAYCTA
jgi:hypothetical protein